MNPSAQKHKCSSTNLDNIVLGKDPSCMAIVPVLSDSRLHLLIHCYELTILPAEIDQQCALWWTIRTTAATASAA